MFETTHLKNNGFITEEQASTIEQFENQKPFSIHWELRLILYLGIVLLTSGLGLLIYQNIDTIGHQAILAIIGALCIGCFYYITKHKQPYQHTEVKHPSLFYDYIVLLGCLLVGIFVGYLQYQYQSFGYHYALLTLLPSVFYLVVAYLYDHKGVLSLGITGIASTLGLTITPMELLDRNDFSSMHLIIMSVLLAMALAGIAILSDRKQIKPHFSFTYHNFAINLSCMALLGALFSQPLKLVSFAGLIVVCVYYVSYAKNNQSFLFLLLSIIYAYIALTYSVFSFLLDGGSGGDGVIYIAIIYVIVSCIGVVKFFLNYKKLLKLN